MRPHLCFIFFPEICVTSPHVRLKSKREKKKINSNKETLTLFSKFNRDYRVFENNKNLNYLKLKQTQILINIVEKIIYII